MDERPLTRLQAERRGPLDRLGARYDALATVVRRHDRTYAAAIQSFPPMAAQELLRTHAAEAPVDSTLRRCGDPHVRSLVARRGTLHNSAVLVLDRIERGRLVAVAAAYFDMLATCDSLRAEWLEATSPESPLPLRSRAEALAGPDPLRSGRGRAAAIGVSVVTTVPRESGRAVVLGRRRDTLATDPGAWHVAPSGMLEPAEPPADSLLATVGSELWEEIGVRLDREALATRLLPLGVGFDLLRLRPELCLRLDLGASEAPDGQPNLSDDEFEDRQEVPLDELPAFWVRHPPSLITPAAAAALALIEAHPRGAD